METRRRRTASTPSMTSGGVRSIVAIRMATSARCSGWRIARILAEVGAGRCERIRAMAWGCSSWMKLTSWYGSVSLRKSKCRGRTEEIRRAMISAAFSGPSALESISSA